MNEQAHLENPYMLLGSVSQHCTQHAPCPVIVIPDDKSTITR